MGEDEKTEKLDYKTTHVRGELMRAVGGNPAYGDRSNPEREVPASVIDFGKVMRARRAAEAEAKALDDADALLEKMQRQLHRMQTMLVAITKRDGRVRITRREIEETEAAREKLAVRIDPETGTVTLEVVT